MFDIETFGTAADTVVISIGAAGYDKEGKPFEFYERLGIEEQIKKGRSITESTLLWWMGQSEEAQTVFRESPTPVDVVLKELAIGLSESMDTKKLEVYGNGASFDITIICNMFEQYNLETPWKFWNERCYRTIKNLFADVILKRKGTHHNALADAQSQLAHLKLISELKDLKLGINV